MVAYEDHDGLSLGEAIRAGELTAMDAVEAAIARIEALNPAVNAVVTKLYDQARATAAAGPRGLFAGVPLLLKDLGGHLKGVETRCGSRFMAGAPARQDQTVVTRLKRAGFVILGKTNVPELGMRPVTDSELYGPARNPWNPARSTGGSSGGAAAAVALGMTPIAHGGDAGGSIRMPAACCGLVGLKPTRGRVPQGPDAGELLAGFLQEHVLTRTVRDSAAVLDCIHGSEPGDPYVAPLVTARFQDVLDDPVLPMSFAVTTRAASGGRAHADCAAATMAAAEALTTLGHHVEMAEPPGWTELLEPALQIGAAWVAWEIDAHAAATGKRPGPDGGLEPATWDLYLAGKAVNASAYLDALVRIQRIARDIAAFMARYDAWLTPTLPAPPVALADQRLADGPARFDPISYVLVANATGQPSISLPLHWSPDGLPIGVLLTGRFGDEAGLLRIAAQLEQAMPWRGRRPPLWT